MQHVPALQVQEENFEGSVSHRRRRQMVQRWKQKTKVCFAKTVEVDEDRIRYLQVLRLCSCPCLLGEQTSRVQLKNPTENVVVFADVGTRGLQTQVRISAKLR